MTRRRWWIVGVLAVWVLVCAFLVVRAASDLRSGRAAAQSARDRLDATAIADGTSLPELRRADARFHSAASKTGNPVLLPVRFLPVVGRQLRSAHAMASAAADVSAAAVDALTRAHEVLKRSSTGDRTRLEQVRALSDAVSKAATRVDAVDDLGPRAGLVGPLVDARNELAKQLAEAKTSLNDAAAGALAGLRLLEGPRRYLLVAANTSEMRAGSGMWLSGGVLNTTGGHIDLGPVSPLYLQADPAKGGAPVTDRDLRDRWGEIWHPNSDWRALMTSPRLSAAADLGLRMWRAAGREPMDGVLVVDPLALAAVIRATGPVEVQGRSISADEVAPLVANQQYQQYNADETPDDRREALGSIASAAFKALDAGEWSPTTLAGELAKAVQGRHLLAWSSTAVEQRGWVAAGMDGNLRPDSLLVSVLNRGGNKLDYFLSADARIATRRSGADTEVTATLDLANATPPGQPHYVTGPPFGQHWEPGRYVGVVSVDVPAAATEVRIDGVARPVTQGPDGAAQVIATDIQIPAGGSQRLVVRFRMPGRHGRLRVEPSARFPGIAWRYGPDAWQDSAPHAAKW